MQNKNLNTESRLRKLFDGSADAFVVLNQAGIIEEWNRCAEKTFGWQASEAIGRKLAELIVPSGIETKHAAHPFAFIATQDPPAKCIEFTAKAASHQSFPVEMTVTRINTENDDEFFVTLRGISARKSSEEELIRNAHHDAHTGLANRGLFNIRLEETLARAMRSSKTVALFFLDIDHFKSINDSMGHDAGDGVLKQFASILKARIRQTDFVARYGGDEFTIILEGITGPDSVTKVANNILNAVREAEWPDSAGFKVTTSIGIAIYDKRDSDPKTLIKMADQAMYASKQSGRNTYKLYADGQNFDVEPKKLTSKISQAKSLFSTSPNKPDFLQNVLSSIREHLDMDVAFISRFHDGVREFEVVDSGNAKAPIAVGDSGPLDESYCLRVVDGRLPEIINDAFDQPEAMRMPVTVALPVRAHMSVPIRRNDGTIYGTFCCFSYKPNQSLNERDIAMMHVLADLVADQLS